MSSEKWGTVCENEQAIPLDIASFCKPVQSRSCNPIDTFYNGSYEIIVLGTPDDMESSQALGRSLLLALVSNTEYYFRSILSGLIRVCPLCKRNAENELLKLGSVYFYDHDDIGLAILENTSFASIDEMKKRVEKITGLSIDRVSTSVSTALDQYAVVCEMRHVVVHSRGVIGEKNKSRFSTIVRSSGMCVGIDYDGLQTVNRICMNVVRVCNSALWHHVIQKWLDRSVLDGSWDNDGKLYKNMFELFKSINDKKGIANAYNSYRSLLPNILSRLAQAKEVD